MIPIHLKVISGGQTGADFAGLLAARKFSVPTGGWSPKGFKTSLGSKPILGTEFHLEETSEEGYQPRTLKNVLSAHVTLISASNIYSAGTALTLRKIRSLRTPYTIFKFENSEAIETALIRNENSLQELANSILQKSLIYENVVLNVAGNSTPSSARAFDFTLSYMMTLLSRILHPNLKNAYWIDHQVINDHRDNYENITM